MFNKSKFISMILIVLCLCSPFSLVNAKTFEYNFTVDVVEDQIGFVINRADLMGHDTFKYEKPLIVTGEEKDEFFEVDENGVYTGESVVLWPIVYDYFEYKNIGNINIDLSVRSEITFGNLSLKEDERDRIINLEELNNRELFPNENELTIFSINDKDEVIILENNMKLIDSMILPEEVGYSEIVALLGIGTSNGSYGFKIVYEVEKSK